MLGIRIANIIIIIMITIPIATRIIYLLLLLLPLTYRTTRINTISHQ